VVHSLNSRQCQWQSPITKATCSYSYSYSLLKCSLVSALWSLVSVWKCNDKEFELESNSKFSNWKNDSALCKGDKVQGLQLLLAVDLLPFVCISAKEAANKCTERQKTNEPKKVNKQQKQYIWNRNWCRKYVGDIMQRPRRQSGWSNFLNRVVLGCVYVVRLSCVGISGCLTTKIYKYHLTIIKIKRNNRNGFNTIKIQFKRFCLCSRWYCGGGGALVNSRPTNLIHSYGDHALDPQQFASMSMSMWMWMQPPKMVEQPPRLGLGLGKIITVQHVVVVVCRYCCCHCANSCDCSNDLERCWAKPAHTCDYTNDLSMQRPHSLCPSLCPSHCPSLTRIVTKNKLCGKAHAEGQNTLPVALNVCGTCNCRVRKFKCKGCHCTRTTNSEQLMILVPHWRWPTLKAKSGCVCAKCMVKAQTRHLFIVNVLSALRALLWRLKRHLTEL